MFCSFLTPLTAVRSPLLLLPEGTLRIHICLTSATINEISCSAASVDLLGGNYNLAWQVLGDKITITMRANTNGWVGFGIPQAASRMVGADVVLGKLRRIF